MPEGLSEAGIKFFEDRGISGETAARFGIYTERPGEDGEAIVYPYWEDGAIKNRKHRGRGKRFWQDADSDKLLWNIDVIHEIARTEQEPRAVVITEGEMDALAVIEAGYSFAVSVPDGAPPPVVGPYDSGDIDPENDAKYSYLWRDWNDIKAVKEFVIAVDGDDAGWRLAQDLAARLDMAKCSFVVYPEGYKDLNEVLAGNAEKDIAALGPEAVIRIVTNPTPWPIAGTYTLDTLPKVPKAPVLTWGIPELDPHFKLRLGDFVVLSGKPGSGKSTLMVNLITNATMLHPRVMPLVASFEKDPGRYLVPEIVRMYLGKSDAEISDIDRNLAHSWINERWTFIEQGKRWDGPDATIDWILERAEDMVRRRGCNILLIDPWNEIEHSREKFETETDYIGTSIRKMKRFAANYDVAVVVIAHPTKPSKDAKVPTLYDISGSANWYNKADTGIILHRERESITSTVIVQKIRFEEVGKPGSVVLSFNTGSLTFSGTNVLADGDLLD